jgi:hypothetical protein
MDSDSVDAIVSSARKSTKQGTLFYVPILTMSATFTMSDQNSFLKYIDDQTSGSCPDPPETTVSGGKLTGRWGKMKDRDWHRTWE